MRITRKPAAPVLVTKTQRERCEEMGARFAAMFEAREAQRLEHLRKADELDEPTEIELSLMLNFEVERRLVDEEDAVLDHIAEKRAEAARLDAKAARLREPSEDAERVAPMLADLRHLAERAEGYVKELDDRVAESILGLESEAEIRRVEAESADAAVESERIEEHVSQLEARAAEADRVTAEAGALRDQAAALREEAQAAEAVLPEYLEDRRLVVARQARADVKAEFERFKLARRVEPPKRFDSADVVDKPIAVRTDPKTGKVSVDLPYDLLI